jgi:hypothetical protein
MTGNVSDEDYGWGKTESKRTSAKSRNPGLNVIKLFTPAIYECLYTQLGLPINFQTLD